MNRYISAFIFGIKYIILGSPFLLAATSFAYDADHPPHRFNEKPAQQFPLQEITPEFRNGGVYLTDGERLLRFMDYEEEIPAEHRKEAFLGDLNRDGIADYIIFSENGGNGIGGAFKTVNIYLSDKNNGYMDISYNGFLADQRDFVNLNGEGRAEVILEDMYPGKNHNYFCYSVYEIIDNKLVDANAKYKGFPKFIWFTYNKNDKPTTHLTDKEKSEFVKEMCGITYQYLAKKDMTN